MKTVEILMMKCGFLFGSIGIPDFSQPYKKPWKIFHKILLNLQGNLGNQMQKSSGLLKKSQ